MESGAHLQALDLAVNQARDGQYLRAIERFESALESGMADLLEFSHAVRAVATHLVEFVDGFRLGT
ncbi:MAG: hypothetical protein E2P03_06970 [Acidobacteria bacterium]|nr:MAG: hypothetical protein E2P03_06970 [Acidobacteriota bacterium]